MRVVEINCWESRGARVPVSHSWRQQCREEQALPCMGPGGGGPRLVHEETHLHLSQNQRPARGMYSQRNYCCLSHPCYIGLLYNYVIVFSCYSRGITAMNSLSRGSMLTENYFKEF